MTPILVFDGFDALPRMEIDGGVVTIPLPPVVQIPVTIPNPVTVTAPAVLGLTPPSVAGVVVSVGNAVADAVRAAADLVLRRNNLPLRITPPVVRKVTQATWDRLVQEIRMLTEVT